MANSFLSQQCSNLLTQDYFENITNTYKFLEDWGFNKIGLYHQCLMDPQNSYFLIHGVTDFDQQQFISGICFASNCTANDINYIFQAINTYLPLPLESIEIVDVKNHVSQFSIGFYVISAILLTLVLLVIIGSLLVTFNIKNPISNFFSISNMTKIIKIKDKKMKIVHALRLLSYIGIFSIHQLQLIVDSFQTNLQIQNNKGFSQLFILNYSVDILFFLNSFAHIYCYLIQVKRKNFYTICINYLQYFMVYYPLYLVGMALVWFILGGLEAGPYYYLLSQYSENQCQNSWIQDVLLISNLTNTKNCNPWLWILQVEFQSRFLMAGFLFAYIWIEGSKFDKIFKWLPMMVSFILIGLTMLFLNPEQTISDKMFHFDTKIQISPMAHLAPYALGFYVAIFFYRTKKNFEQRFQKIIEFFSSQIVTFFLFIIPTLLIGASQYYFYWRFDEKIGYLDLVFLQLLHFLIPFMILLFIIRTLLGFRTFLRYFALQYFLIIGSKFLLPTAMISHYLIQVHRLFSKTTEIYYDFSTYIFCCISNLCLTLIFALVLAIILYMPLTTLKYKLCYQLYLE